MADIKEDTGMTRSQFLRHLAVGTGGLSLAALGVNFGSKAVAEGQKTKEEREKTSVELSFDELFETSETDIRNVKSMVAGLASGMFKSEVRPQVNMYIRPMETSDGNEFAFSYGYVISSGRYEKVVQNVTGDMFPSDVTPAQMIKSSNFVDGRTYLQLGYTEQGKNGIIRNRYISFSVGEPRLARTATEIYENAGYKYTRETKVQTRLRGTPIYTEYKISTNSGDGTLVNSSITYNENGEITERYASLGRDSQPVLTNDPKAEFEKIKTTFSS